ALDRLAQHPLGVVVPDITGDRGPEATRVARVAVVELLIELATAQPHPIGVDHYDEAAGIDVGGEGGLVLPTQHHGDAGGETTELVIGGVDHVPLAIDLAGLGLVGSHLVSVPLRSPPRTTREVVQPERPLAAPGGGGPSGCDDAPPRVRGAPRSRERQAPGVFRGPEPVKTRSPAAWAPRRPGYIACGRREASRPASVFEDGPHRGDAHVVDDRLAADLDRAEVDVGVAVAAVDPARVEPAAVDRDLQLGLPALARHHGVDAQIVLGQEARAEIEVVVEIGVAVVATDGRLAPVVLPRHGDAAVLADTDDRVLRVVVALRVAGVDADLLVAHGDTALE